ncbi:hypothetical protein LTR04_002346 [Oleoguttula sp. CCFEE 6159]|nr:hypothetical protein LTR04_002346 [Oleoguttula sp. CCFEE 6159]
MAVDVLPASMSTCNPAKTLTKGVQSEPVVPRAKIIDIRREKDGLSIVDDIREGLRPEQGAEKRLPTLLLYDEAGLRLFERITYLEEYYLTNAEIEVLEIYADQIAQRIEAGSLVVELGSGNLRKVNILLQAINRAGKDVEYYALDLSLDELQRTLAEVPSDTYEHVKCFGLHGTYDDGLAWLKLPENATKPKCVLSLGSSIGNFKRDEAAAFLRRFADILHSRDSMIIGIDACEDPDKVYHAYNDREGLTHEFVLNGLQQANRLLGREVFDIQKWSVIGEYDGASGRHHAFVTPIEDVRVDDVLIKSGERVRIEESYKYSSEQSRRLWAEANLAEGATWSTANGDYSLHMLSRPRFAYSPHPEVYAARPVPRLSEWTELWAAWDAVTRGMIPQEELLSKPIKLRNACIFYLGHIPTFLDMHLTRATGGHPTEPRHYPQIFERGIDPDVDNPEQCHAHSEIPDSWPPAGEILDFQDRVRGRVADIYATGADSTDLKVGRALWLAYEHEMMHLETLLYMLVQSEKTLPPPSTIAPDFQALAQKAKVKAVENQWFDIPATDIKVGLDDPENSFGPDRYFGWDNEKPRRTSHVDAFRAKARPITNEEYAQYLHQNKLTTIPASWTYSPTANGSTKQVNGTANGHAATTSKDSSIQSVSLTQAYLHGKSVRTVYGAVPLEYALDWPVCASYDELASCAIWMGGRIPTMDEARSIYSYVDAHKRKEADQALGKTIPAVNGHLVNNGVEETPPSNGSTNGSSSTASGLNPHDLFIDLEDANVGFHHWCPVSVSQNGNRLSGQADMGGLWEWTSTVLEKHDGFEPMDLYPAYTADFFDKKHNVVLGGSWATHPRIAGRKTFVNWYQRNYPYVWAGARLVRDM